MPQPQVQLSVATESFSIRGGFRISRGAKTEAVVVVMTLQAMTDAGSVIGRGECVPYARYGETVADVMAAITDQTAAVAAGMGRQQLRQQMPRGAARNALDCALWDLQAKLTGQPVWALAGLSAPPAPVYTAFTLSLDAPTAMAEAAQQAAGRPVLKLKLGGDDLDVARVQAVRQAAPMATLIVDANEGWTLAHLSQVAPILHGLGVAMIEQPLPSGDDAALRDYRGPVPLGADESAHGLDDVAALADRYRVINVKLDKTGGLTEALMVRDAARAAGLDIMVGCMVATSLAMAPAMLLTAGARYVDLDGPLLLQRDRVPGLRYDGALAWPPEPELWG